MGERVVTALPISKKLAVVLSWPFYTALSGSLPTSDPKTGARRCRSSRQSSDRFTVFMDRGHSGEKFFSDSSRNSPFDDPDLKRRHRSSVGETDFAMAGKWRGFDSTKEDQIGLQSPPAQSEGERAQGNAHAAPNRVVSRLGRGFLRTALRVR